MRVVFASFLYLLTQIGTRRRQPSRGEWKRTVHPEGTSVHLSGLYPTFNFSSGNVYYCDPTRQIATVTDSDLTDDNILHKIEHAYDLVLRRANRKYLDIESLNLELVLEFHPEDGGNTCAYYLVDHDTRTLFWMDEGLTTDSLGLHPVSSPEHLSSLFLYLTDPSDAEKL